MGTESDHVGHTGDIGRWPYVFRRPWAAMGPRSHGEAARGSEQSRRLMHRVTLGASLAVLLIGCTAIGPSTVGRDRLGYTAAVAESWKTQMLLNIVKLRYSDTPVFLDVGQIVSGYTVETSLSAAANANIYTWSVPHPNFPDASVGVGALGRYQDRPTVTYSPLAGERFARSLMTPIRPVTVLSLIQGGYPVDVVMRLVVNAVNGIDNRFGGDSRAHLADPEFYPLIRAMRRIQLSGTMGMRVQRNADQEATLVSFRTKRDPESEAAVAEVRQLLGLDPKAEEFRVVYGSGSTSDREIAILTRSILEILVDLSSFITVPASHVAEGRVNAALEDPAGESLPPLIRIRSMPEAPKPEEVFVTVPYRGHWFTIDDRDIPSKRLFTFMMFVFTLVETPTKEAPPIVTIPAQ